MNKLRIGETLRLLNDCEVSSISDSDNEHSRDCSEMQEITDDSVAMDDHLFMWNSPT